MVSEGVQRKETHQGTSEGTAREVGGKPGENSSWEPAPQSVSVAPALGENQMEQMGVRWNQEQGSAAQRSLEELCSSARREYRGWHFLPRHMTAAGVQSEQTCLGLELSLEWAPGSLPGKESSREGGSSHLPCVLNTSPVPCLCLQSSFCLK